MELNPNQIFLVIFILAVWLPCEIDLLIYLIRKDRKTTFHSSPTGGERRETSPPSSSGKKYKTTPEKKKPAGVAIGFDVTNLE